MDSRFRKWVKNHIRVGIRRPAKFALFETLAAFQTGWTAFVRPRKAARNLKLHLGCGAKRKEGWVNIDLHPKADIKTDIRRRIPLDDGSAEIIYSEHLFEHLEYPEEAVQFLQETYRLLAPGGRFSVGVPDTELVLRAYSEGDFAREKLGLSDVPWCDTPMHHINFLFHQGGEHKHLYDFDTLVRVLHRAGYENVHRRQFDSQLDSKDREIGTLYVDAQKPLTP